MILDKKIEVCVTAQTRKHYYKLGYSNLKIYDVIEIPVEHLSINSHHRINCQCDICGNIKSTTYQDYLSKIKYDGKYYCRECMKEKRKITLKEKYGIENVFQLEDIKKQSEKTKLEKYGNKKYRNDELRGKTIFKKYGCSNVFQNEEIKEKSRSTNIKNIGVEYAQQNEKILEKSLNSGLKIKYHHHPVYYQNLDIYQQQDHISFFFFLPYEHPEYPVYPNLFSF